MTLGNSSTRSRVCALLCLAAVLALCGSAAAQAASTEPEESTAVARAEASEHLLRFALGAGLMHATSTAEPAADRGAAAIEVGVHPVRRLELAVDYSDTLGAWTYLLPTPSLDGRGLARATSFEHLHDLGLEGRYDVLALLAGDDTRVHLMPALRVGYVAARSSVLSSQMFAVGPGLRLGVDVDAHVQLLGAFGALFGLAKKGGDTTLLGGLERKLEWSAGASVGAVGDSRIGISYVGELLVRRHANRYANGAHFTFEVSLL